MKVIECAGKTYRMTRQRQTVLDVLRRTNPPQDATWVYQEVRKVIPNISPGTVYRTLNLLRRAGVVAGVKVEGSTGYYDTSADLHYHVTCTACGRTVEGKADAGEALKAQVASATGFVITGHHLGFCGLCSDCAQRQQ